MNDAFEELNNEKDRLQKVTAPPEFEARIRHALEKKNQRKPRKFILIAAILVLSFLTAYNAQTLAYYGKQILGFDEVMGGQLQELNKAGMGQVINKTYTLKDGIEVTLNGVMSDQNQLLAYITLKSNGLDLSEYSLQSHALTGFFTRAKVSSGVGKLSEDKHEVKWEWSYAPPSALAKNLTMHFQLFGPNQYHDSGEITFTYDRSKAMALTVEKSINQHVIIGESSVTLNELKASPTQTVLTGEFTVPEELPSYKLNGAEFDIALVANGNPVIQQGGQFGSSRPNKTSFTIRYDALPTPLKSLHVKMTKAPAHEVIEKSIPLTKLVAGSSIDLVGEQIEVISKDVTSTQTSVTLKMGETVYLSHILLQHGANKVVGEETEASYAKDADGIKRIVTYTFHSKEEFDTLVINDYFVSKDCDEVVDIPLK